MNVRIQIIALVLAAVLVLAGCGGKGGAQSGPKAGVVYLDPNATAASTAAPRVESTAVPATAGQAPAQEAASDEAPAPDAALDLYFECRGVRVEPLMEAAPVVAALGEPIRRFEADSCAYVGKDVFYVYPGVQLTVNQVEGVERITSILVTDDTVTIPQGLRIYDEEEKLLDLLGGTDENGVYFYQSGHTELLIQVKDSGDDGRRISYMEYRVADDQ